MATVQRPTESYLELIRNLSRYAEGLSGDNPDFHQKIRASYEYLNDEHKKYIGPLDVITSSDDLHLKAISLIRKIAL